MGAIDQIPPEVKNDERPLLLFWALHEPMTVQNMADKGYLGDVGLQEESYERTFRRLRGDFEENGIYLVEHHVGNKVSYQVDSEKTYVHGTVPTQSELLELVLLLGSYLDAADDLDSAGRGPYLDCLRRARDKLACVAPGASVGGSPTASDDASVRGFSALVDSYVCCRGVSFGYTDASGRSSQRDVDVYGVFQHDGRTFFAGFDRTRDGMRVFRDDRIDLASVKVLKRSFDVPADFCIDDYRKLPFEYGDEKLAASFRASGTEGAGRPPIVHTRGSWDGDVWTVDVCDLDKAAEWSCLAMEAGLVPQTPPALLDALRTGLRKVVESHGN